MFAGFLQSWPTPCTRQSAEVDDMTTGVIRSLDQTKKLNRNLDRPIQCCGPDEAALNETGTRGRGLTSRHWFRPDAKKINAKVGDYMNYQLKRRNHRQNRGGGYALFQQQHRTAMVRVPVLGQSLGVYVIQTRNPPDF